MISEMKTFNTSEPLRTPVLLIVFNRPETTRVVFEAIRKAKPMRLYIAADGPRPGMAMDTLQCELTRKIVTNVDWDCEVKTLFHDVNLNCGVAPSSAFTWFFQHEVEGIILEDDCLPVQSFFWFCQELLERFRDDTRVMHIGGNNFLNGWKKDHDYSYYFSQSGHIWGWATWRRAWQKYDFNIGLYDKVKRNRYFSRYFLNLAEEFYRLGKFDKTITHTGQVTWWDYQWDFARYVNSGLAIVPEVNLVKNIGFNESATHTKNSRSTDANINAYEIDFPLRHPPYVIRDKESERKYLRNFIRDIMISKLRMLS
jgi:hypothetical protein